MTEFNPNGELRTRRHGELTDIELLADLRDREDVEPKDRLVYLARGRDSQLSHVTTRHPDGRMYEGADFMRDIINPPKAHRETGKLNLSRPMQTADGSRKAALVGDFRAYKNHDVHQRLAFLIIRPNGSTYLSFRHSDGRVSSFSRSSMDIVNEAEQ